MNQILSYIHLKQNQISLNGEIIFSVEKEHSLTEFLSDSYKNFEFAYPKFHKMDALCKLGFIATEVLFSNSDFITKNNKEKMAIVLSNNASSLETDRVYQNSISDKKKYFPSPAVFVYTLPNIVIGEIAIRHKITGENAFFVSQKIDATLLSNYTNLILNKNYGESAISGWLNVDKASYEGFIILVGKEENTNKNSIFKPLNQLNVLELYNQTIWMH